VIGRRVEWGAQLLEPGEYSKLPEGMWYACSPNGHTANLERHTVVEHEDGTITVSPSILIRGHQISEEGVRVSDDICDLWHGYLERGVWRSC
jgi:hypothetical protein